MMHLLSWALTWMTVPGVFVWAAWQHVDRGKRWIVLLIFGAWGLSMAFLRL